MGLGRAPAPCAAPVRPGWSCRRRARPARGCRGFTGLGKADRIRDDRAGLVALQQPFDMGLKLSVALRRDVKVTQGGQLLPNFRMIDHDQFSSMLNPPPDLAGREVVVVLDPAGRLPAGSPLAARTAAGFGAASLAS